MSVNKLPYQLLPHCRRLLRALLWHTRKLKLFKLIWQLTQIQLIGNITLQRADLKTFCGVTEITKSIRVPVFYFSFPLSVASIRCRAVQQHGDVGLETRCQVACWLSLRCKSLAVPSWSLGDKQQLRVAAGTLCAPVSPQHPHVPSLLVLCSS